MLTKRRSREQSEQDSLYASPIREVTERPEEEGIYVPAQNVVMAGPGPREESVEKFHRSSSLKG
jgi:hypothetical protein